MGDARSSKTSRGELSAGQRNTSSSLQNVGSAQQIILPLVNDQIRLLNKLLGNLAASDDLRFHLPWTYGGFLDDVPRRIGSNRALDAAADALMTAHAGLGARRGTHGYVTSKVLLKYSHALKTLRLSLDDTEVARSPETLCAVYLLFICEAFLGRTGCNHSTHGEGSAQILKVRGFKGARGEFERKLLLTLRGPVLFEALVNPRISFTPTQWQSLVANELDGASFEGHMMQCLSTLPDIMHRGKVAMRFSSDLQNIIDETQYQYTVSIAILSSLRERLQALKEVTCVKNSASPSTHVHAYFQRTYGLGLSICLSYNCVLQSLAPEDSALDHDANCFSDEVLALAEAASIYRPLGASYVMLCLIGAWCSSRNEASKNIIEAVLTDYYKDFNGKYMGPLTSGLESISMQLRLFPGSGGLAS